MKRFMQGILGCAFLSIFSVANAAEFPVYIDGTQRVQIASGAKDQNALPEEQSVFYQVAYPKNFKELGLEAPMCNPCDHAKDGVQWTDFHDHLLTREDLPYRHVFNIGPAYTGDEKRDAEIVKIYTEQLPITSAVEANQLLAMRSPSGNPVATLTDFGFYFKAVLKD